MRPQGNFPAKFKWMPQPGMFSISPEHGEVGPNGAMEVPAAAALARSLAPFLTGLSLAFVKTRCRTASGLSYRLFSRWYCNGLFFYHPSLFHHSIASYRLFFRWDCNSLIFYHPSELIHDFVNQLVISLVMTMIVLVRGKDDTMERKLMVSLFKLCIRKKRH